MSSLVYPHSRLLVRSSFSIAISGPHIQLVDPRTGCVVNSTTKFNDSHRDDILKSGHVRCAALDPSNAYLATVGDDKMLKVWDLAKLELLSSRELPKRPTSILFTANSQTILVADKFGDVFSYPLHPVPGATPSPEPATKDPLASHENPWGELVLGHVSLLTAFLLTPDEKYIITADRDEHIRVSWFPQGYCIERYCLGHKKFVSAIHIPDFAPDTLISGGGDPVIKIWNWMAGSVKREVCILGAVEPFIKVRPRPRRRSDDEGEGDAVESSTQPQSKSKGGKRGRPEERDEEREPGPSVDPDESEEQGKVENVLVVHKIASLDTPTRCIIFSLIGASALFSCPFLESGGEQNIKLFDFGLPIIDFEIAPDGSIWVSLDALWDKGHGQVNSPEFVRVVTWTGSEFTEAHADSALLMGLNSACVISASNKDLESLDLYGLLSALPKNHRLEPEVDNRQQGTEEGKEPSKRALGRMKVKQRLANAGQQLSQNEGTMDGDRDKRAKPGHGKDTTVVAIKN